MSGTAASRLTHADATGRARMVDVGDKRATARRAVAEAVVELPRDAYDALAANELAKGDALGVARLAGIMAAKRTGSLIPLCHPLALDHVELSFELDAASRSVRIVAGARTRGRTGVEMEAMVAAALAALTIYDMAKGVSKGIAISRVRLLEKSGGKSGTWRAADAAEGVVETPSRPARRAAGPTVRRRRPSSR